jgi:pimeloyl-ACP methyl ester carboxylesterase
MDWKFKDEALELDAAAREQAPGEFIKLPDGYTHYELAGDPGGQTVVLVHGFSVPYFIWDPTFDALLDAGFRVLRYDLYGRGYSDRPAIRYDIELFDRQLIGLLDALGVDSRADVVGLSMGGPVTCAFAARHPERVRRVALFDPAGFPMRRSFSEKLIQIKYLGEWLFDSVGEEKLVAGQKADFKYPDRFPEYFEQYRLQMKYRGFKQALLSTIRSGMLVNAWGDFSKLSETGIPVLLVWGEEDITVPFELNARVREAIPHLKFIPVKDCRHLPHYECPEVVNPVLIEFLS